MFVVRVGKAESATPALGFQRRLYLFWAPASAGVSG